MTNTAQATVITCAVSVRIKLNSRKCLFNQDPVLLLDFHQDKGILGQAA